MNELRNLPAWIQKALESNPLLPAKLVVSLLVVFAIWLLRRILIRIVSKRVQDPRSLYQWRKGSGATAIAIGLLTVGRIWFEGVHSVTTFLGLLAAGLAIALREPLTDMAGWAFIVGRQLFKVGDRIQIGEHSGDVIDINIFHFTLLEIGNWVDADQSTGRMVQIPNGMVFRKEQANYTKGFQYIWNEMPVLITFESNWQKAKELLSDIVSKRTGEFSHKAESQIREASRRFLIFYSYLDPKVYTTVRESGVLLTIRHLCHPRQRRDVAEGIWEDVLRAFAKADDIDFAYPTQRFYDHAGEGKPPSISEGKR